jgi:glycosyltransferase involved in cell wall biosynthesis
MEPSKAHTASPARVLELRSVWGTGGGPEKTILLGAAQSDPNRFGITVCYIRDERDPVFGIDRRAGELDIDYVEVRERHSFDPSVWPVLRKLVADRRIDIVHAHDHKTDLLALLLGRFEPVIPLSTAHGWAGHSWKEQRLYYPADRRLLARFPKVIVVSSDMRESLLRCGARADRIAVVPNGVDQQQFARNEQRVSSARESLGVSPGAVVVGTVGRLESEKNYGMLIRAFREAASANAELQLLIAGDGSLSGDLQGQIDGLGLSDRCRLLGHVEDVIGFYHALDVFVLCSDNEGSPNAVLESMAVEIPVIATGVGGIPDLLTSDTNGILVGRRDQTGLAGAIRRLATDPGLRRRLGRAAREKVERELSFAGRMRKVEGVYEELMSAYPGVRHGSRWQSVGGRSIS